MMNYLHFLQAVVFILFFSFIEHVLSKPTWPALCKPGEFYDEVLLAYHPCSVCFMREGRMFKRQCNFCNCSAIHTTTTIKPPTTTSLPSSNVALTSNQTIHRAINSTVLPQITLPTASATDKVSLYHFLIAFFSICFGVVIIVVLLGSVRYFLCRTTRQSHSVASTGQVQGCFHCVLYPRESTECSQANDAGMSNL